MVLDLQTALTALVKQQRQEEFAHSPQLSLGEIITKLEGIVDKARPVYFDFKEYCPVGIDSWRGSYDELALDYGLVNDPPSVKDVLEILQSAVGTTYQGYKGGDFRMSRHTPVWVADYGNYMIPYGNADEYSAVYVSDVTDGDRVLLVTCAKQN